MRTCTYGVGYGVACSGKKAMREPRLAEQQYCSPAFNFVYLILINHLIFMAIHIGKTIEHVLREQGRSVSWFAKQICCERTNVYSIFRRSSIDTDLLMRISKILSYDFFEEYREVIKQKEESHE